NHDLGFAGGPATTGRLFSAPELCGNALCFGFHAATSRFALALLALLAAAPLGAALTDPRWLLGLLLPLLLALHLLAQRARLRAAVWQAVEGVMCQRSGRPFDLPGHVSS